MIYGAEFLEGVLRLACVEVPALNGRLSCVEEPWFGRPAFDIRSPRVRGGSMEAGSNGSGALNRMRRGSRANQNSRT
jgi:hypothetical protein